MEACKGFTQKHQKLGTALMPFSWWLDKQTVVCAVEYYSAREKHRALSWSSQRAPSVGGSVTEPDAGLCAVTLHVASQSQPAGLSADEVCLWLEVRKQVDYRAA